MSYRVPVLSRFAWQEPVNLITATAPSNPVKGDRYIDSTNGRIFMCMTAGAFEATYDSPVDGWRVFNKADASYYTFTTGNGWTSGQTMNGLTLTGDVDSTALDINWKLKDDSANAFSFDSEGSPNIFSVSTLDAAGGAGVAIDGTLTVSEDVTVNGDLTVNGTVTTLNATNTDITDKFLTLNKGGSAASTAGTGIGFEELVDDIATITGYVKVAAARDSILVKAPIGGELTVKATADSILAMGANLTVSGVSAIDQDVTKTATGVQFGSVVVAGSGSFGGALDAGVSTLASLGVTGAATIGSSLGVTTSATIGTTLDVTGKATVGTLDVLGAADFATTVNVDGAATFGDTVAVTGAATFATTVGVVGLATVGSLNAGAATFTSTVSVAGEATFAGNVTDGTNTLTVANMRKSFDSRGKWDEALGCIMFDNLALDPA